MNVFCFRYYSECAVCIVITVVLITVMILATVGSEGPRPVHIGLCRDVGLCRPKLRTPGQSSRSFGGGAKDNRRQSPKPYDPY